MPDYKITLKHKHGGTRRITVRARNPEEARKAALMQYERLGYTKASKPRG